MKKLTWRLNSALGTTIRRSVSAFTFRTRTRTGRSSARSASGFLKLALLTELNGGATAMPQTEGVWGNERGKLIWEHPVVVYSFIRGDLFFANLARIREFLHRMGRETNQGEVAVEYQKQFFLIREYDPPTEGTGGKA